MRLSSRRLAVAVLLGGIALSSCTSSSPHKNSPGPPSSSLGPASVSVAPSTSASPKLTPPPLSAFEADPAVQAVRKFQDVYGRTINTGHYTSAALQALVTPYVAKNIKQVSASDVGSYFPGPVPFQPVGVTVNNATMRTVRGCLVTIGWGESRATHKPLKPYVVTPADFVMVKNASGEWLVNGLPVDKHLSCKTITVKTRKW